MESQIITAVRNFLLTIAKNVLSVTDDNAFLEGVHLPVDTLNSREFVELLAILDFAPKLTEGVKMIHLKRIPSVT